MDKDFIFESHVTALMRLVVQHQAHTPCKELCFKCFSPVGILLTDPV